MAIPTFRMPGETHDLLLSLFQAMLNAGKSVPEAVACLGVSHGTMHKLRSSVNPEFSLSTYVNICYACRCEPGNIFLEEDFSRRVSEKLNEKPDQTGQPTLMEEYSVYSTRSSTADVGRELLDALRQEMPGCLLFYKEYNHNFGLLHSGECLADKAVSRETVSSFEHLLLSANDWGTCGFSPMIVPQMRDYLTVVMPYWNSKQKRGNARYLRSSRGFQSEFWVNISGLPTQFGALCCRFEEDQSIEQLYEMYIATSERIINQSFHDRFWLSRHREYAEARSAITGFPELVIGEPHIEELSRILDGFGWDYPLLNRPDFFEPKELLQGLPQQFEVRLADVAHLSDSGVPIREQRKPGETSRLAAVVRKGLLEAFLGTLAGMLDPSRYKITYGTIRDTYYRHVTIRRRDFHGDWLSPADRQGSWCQSIAPPERIREQSDLVRLMYLGQILAKLSCGKLDYQIQANQTDPDFVRLDLPAYESVAYPQRTQRPRGF